MKAPELLLQGLSCVLLFCVCFRTVVVHHVRVRLVLPLVPVDRRLRVLSLLPLHVAGPLLVNSIVESTRASGGEGFEVYRP